MGAYVVMAAAAVAVSLTMLGYLGRRISLDGDEAPAGLCRLDLEMPAGAGRCVECGG